MESSPSITPPTPTRWFEPTATPSAEVCDGIDNDDDSTIDEGLQASDTGGSSLLGIFHDGGAPLHLINNLTGHDEPLLIAGSPATLGQLGATGLAVDPTGKLVYLVTGDSDDSLYTLDTGSGLISRMGPLAKEASNVQSLDLAPLAASNRGFEAGQLYGISIDGFGDCSPSCLVRVDPSTAETHIIGPIQANQIRGLSFDPKDGQLWGFDTSSRGMYTVGADGELTYRYTVPAGNQGMETGASTVYSLAHGCDGALYGVDVAYGVLLRFDEARSQAYWVGEYGEISHPLSSLQLHGIDRWSGPSGACGCSPDPQETPLPIPTHTPVPEPSPSPTSFVSPTPTPAPPQTPLPVCPEEAPPQQVEVVDGCDSDLRVQTREICHRFQCDDLRVSYEVSNFGGQNLPAGIPISLYAVGNDGKYLWLETTTLPFIAAGSSTGGLVWNLGEYEAYSQLPELVLAVDDDGTGESLISECDEHNNLNTFVLSDLNCPEAVACEQSPPAMRIESNEACVWEPELGGTFEPVVEWQHDSFEDGRDLVIMQPVVGNLTDDNGDSVIDELDVPDIAFINTTQHRGPDGTLTVLSGDDGHEIFSVANLGLDSRSGVALGDVDADGLPELFATTFSGDLIAIDYLGRYLWTCETNEPSAQTSGNTSTAPYIGNVDGVGDAEILIGSSLCSSGGDLIVTTDLRHDAETSFLVDIDLDGEMEIASGRGVSRRDGSTMFSAAGRYGAVGNFDNDPFPELVSVDAGSVRLYDDNGQTIWTGNTTDSRGGPPTIADFDGDGEPEIGVAFLSRYRVYDTDGNQIWSQPIYETSSGVTGSSVFDFDGDGVPEVIYADQSDLWVFAGPDGDVRARITGHASTTWLEYPVIADVDRDGNAEIVLASNNHNYPGWTGITVIGDANDAWATSRPVWNQHAYHLTNINDDLSVPKQQIPNWLEGNNTFRQGGFASAGALAAPDLAAAFVDSCPAESCLSSGRILFRVENRGAIEVGPGLPWALYGQSAGSPPVLLHASAVELSIPAGWATNALELTLPVGATAYEKLILIVDDDGAGNGSHRECNEENNRLILPVVPQPGDGAEICDLADNDCDGLVDEGLDQDGDGLSHCTGDCDDTNADVGAGMLELCDGIDQDCDGQIDEDYDLDQDGWTTCNGDCSDSSPGSAPGGVEALDGLDNDCDGTIDEGYVIEEEISLTDDVPFELDDDIKPFPFIWVAVSTKGTIVKIDTQTGEVLGEYLTAPDGRGRNPSRTTVDKLGNVWVGNRDEASGNFGSIARVGLYENGQCEDRNGNGLIETSTGLDDIMSWPNLSGEDSLGGVLSADDECIVNYTRTHGTNVRHVSVDSNNDVWVGGYGGDRDFDLISGESGDVLQHFPGIGYGGYGGVIDSNFVIWSASYPQERLRWSTSLDLISENVQLDGGSLYGTAIDSAENVWHTSLGGNGRVYKFAPDGTLLAAYPQGDGLSKGVAVDALDHVWIANTGSSGVSHLAPDGSYIGKITVGVTPTGVSIDATGKVWVTNYDSKNVMRIDPSLGDIGGDGVTPIGAVDFVSGSLGGSPYNYSDMTGSALIGAPNEGTLTVLYDSGVGGTPWGTITWIASIPDGAELLVSAVSSEAPTSFGSSVGASNGVDLEIPTGRYLQVTIRFIRADDGLSPILHSLLILPEGQTLQGAPPTIVSTPNYSSTEGQPYIYQVEAIDPEGGPIRFALNQHPLGMGIKPQTGLIDWRPTVTQVGPHEARVIAQDDAGLKDEQVFTIVVEPGTNLAPEITSAPVVAAAAGYPYSYLAVADDPNGDPLLFSITVGPTEMAVNPISGLITWLPNVEDLGIHPVEVRVQDDRGRSAIQRFEIIVSTNARPVASAGTDFVALLGYTAALDGTASYDPDGDLLTYQWQVIDAPPGSLPILWDDTHSRATLLPDMMGIYELVLAVSDGIEVSTPESVLIQVRTNSRPTFSSTPGFSAATGIKYTYPASAIDSDGDQLVWSLSTGPSGVSVDPGSGLLEWTPREDQGGTQLLALRVSDGWSYSEQQWMLSVTDSGELDGPPVITSTPSTQAWADRAYVYQVEAYDPGGDQLTYDLPSHPDGMVVDGQSGLISWLPTADDIGSQSIRVAVTDGVFTTSQTWTLVVSEDDGVNQAPEILSRPRTAAMAGQTYAYQVSAADPDGDEMQYTLVEMPNGMSVSEETGLVSWQPSAADVGVHPVQVSVSDGQLTATQSFTLTVRADEGGNASPSILGSPPSQAKATFTYRYPVEAEDPDGDVLSYSLVEPPSGMVVDANTGVVTWTPGEAQVGQHQVAVRVSDGLSYVQQSWTIYVVEASTILAVELIITPIHVNEGETVILSAWVTGAVGPANVELTVDGEPVELDALGAATVVSEEIGPHAVVASATDDYDEAIKEDAFYVRDPSDVTPPLVEIVSPSEDVRVTAPLPITATVSDENLSSWRLSYVRSHSEEAPSILAEGTTSFVEQEIADFDPTLLLNGQYALILEATDTSGQTSVDSRVLMVTGEMKVGHFSITFEDLSIPVSGIPITVNRTYDSRRRNEALDFGHGWSIDYQDVRVDESRTPGKGWALNRYRSGPYGAIQELCVEPLGAPVITVTLPDGAVEEFEARAEPECTLYNAIIDVQLVFEPRQGTQSSLTQNQFGLVRLVNGSLVNLDEPETPIDPNIYQLTTEGGYVYNLDQAFGIRSVADPNGNTLTYTDDGIFHSDGKSVRFDRGSDGQIHTIIDPMGHKIQYGYDSRKDLVSVVDQVQSQVSYAYQSEHLLLDIIDPLGRKVVRNIYDEAGRLIAQEDGEGNRTEFNHDLEGRLSVITDRLQRSTLHYYDEEGRITTTIDANGAQTDFTYNDYGRETSRTYHITDEDGAERELTWSTEYNDRQYPISETDPGGHTVYYDSNEQGYVTTFTDQRGYETDYEYDILGNLTHESDPLGNVTQRVYDEKGNLEAVIDALGDSYLYEFDEFGNETRSESPAGAVTLMDYDANGNLVSETRMRTSPDGDPIEETWTFTYNAKGRLTTLTDPLGREERTEYDELGRETVRTNVAGERIEMTYDGLGRLTKTLYEDETIETVEYDAEGNPTRRVDREGNETLYNYDGVDQVTSIKAPGEPEITHDYYENGWMRARCNGARCSSYVHDDAGNRVSSTDPDGLTVSRRFDESGNLLESIDKLGRSTEYDMDELGQRVRVTYPDDTYEEFEHDELGRIEAQVDHLGRRVQFDYDFGGQLSRVVQFLEVLGEAEALQVITHYEYDEWGNRTAQIDAEGSRTEWTYDLFGREQTRRLPLGQVEWTEYDELGRPSLHTDFQGRETTMEYDLDGNLRQRSYESGLVEIFEYNTSGQATAVNGEHGRFEFTYDDGGRLKTQLRPDGIEVTHGYDEDGRRTSLETDIAGREASWSYTYDTMDRLETVTDAEGAVVYTYDQAGRLTDVTFPSGVTEHNEYDLMDRLKERSLRDPQGALVGQYTYELELDGRRLSVSELSGRVVQYTYDSLSRLTGERLMEPGQPVVDILYAYDLAGNRIGMTVDGEFISYSYDANDRLLSVGDSELRYDDGGNLLALLTEEGDTFFQFDERNRLVQVDRIDETSVRSVIQGYDHEGLRLFRSTAEPESHRDYVLDRALGYAEVIHDVNEGGSVDYTYGHNLLARRSEQGSYSSQHFDGHRDLRVMMDGVGAVAGRYDYDAFGNVISQLGASSHEPVYGSHRLDERSGLYYMRARHYLPAIGRFVSMDSYAGNASFPITLNKYIYGSSEPVNGWDPSGLATLTEQGATGSVQGTLATSSQPSYAFILRALRAFQKGTKVLRAQTRTGVNVGKYQIRQCLRNMSVKGKMCRSPVPIIYLGMDNYRQTFNVLTGMLEKSSSPILLRIQPKHPKGWYVNKPECKKINGLNPRNKDCDEYPYNSSLLGGPSFYENGTVQLAFINRQHNRRAGTKLNMFYGRANGCGIVENNPIKGIFGVIPTPRATTKTNACPGTGKK